MAKGRLEDRIASVGEMMKSLYHVGVVGIPKGGWDGGGPEVAGEKVEGEGQWG